MKEGCYALGGRPNLSYLFTHILGEIDQEASCRGMLGPEQLLALTSSFLLLPSVSKGILSLKEE